MASATLRARRGGERLGTAAAPPILAAPVG